jgi:predicted RNase H-like nuclease (RuvC/YqgF family)
MMFSWMIAKACGVLQAALSELQEAQKATQFASAQQAAALESTEQAMHAKAAELESLAAAHQQLDSLAKELAAAKAALEQELDTVKADSGKCDCTIVGSVSMLTLVCDTSAV